MRLRSTLLFASVAAAGPIAHGAEPLVPIEAFVEPQQYSQPRLSPDGKHLAVNVRIKRGDRTIPTMTVYSLPALQRISTIALPGYEVPADFFWVTNQRLVVKKGLELGLRERPVATGEVVAVNLDGSKPEYLYGYKNFKQSSRGDRYGDDYGYGSVVQIPDSRDGHLLVGSYDWEGSHSLLYDVNSTNAVRKLLADIAAKDLDFVVQNNGTPRFAYGTDDHYNAILFRRDDASGEWRPVEGERLGVSYRPFAFTPDDKAFYVRHSEKGGPNAILKEDLASGQRTPVASDPLGSVDVIEYTSRPEVPFAVATSTGIPKARYLDETSPDAQLHKTLSALFPDGYVHFLNFTDDGQKLLFSVGSDRDPGSFYVFDRKTGKADLLLSNMPRIDAEQMAARAPIVFTARDGLKITGYLTKPKNPGNKKLPMVLLPHGGPFDISDEWYFDSDAQFLASRGYAVLQVNFRGSSGRGGGFLLAGYREWGGKVLDDLVDGVKWASAQPDIDGARVCVYGISFGGYAALMLPAREPAMFKCSVGTSGVYYLPQLYDDEGVKGKKRAINYLVKTMGDDRALLEASSPTLLADKIRIPVLLAHGTKDKIAPIVHANMMRDALIKAGRPPQWLVLEDEGHSFYDPDRQKQYYRTLEGFLAKHLGK
ncbi:MAG: alpha/beta hydrolase family protein [Massilia sp.]